MKECPRPPLTARSWRDSVRLNSCHGWCRSMHVRLLGDCFVNLLVLYVGVFFFFLLLPKGLLPTDSLSLDSFFFPCPLVVPFTGHFLWLAKSPGGRQSLFPIFFFFLSPAALLYKAEKSFLGFISFIWSGTPAFFASSPVFLIAYFRGGPFHADEGLRIINPAFFDCSRIDLLSFLLLPAARFGTHSCP